MSFEIGEELVFDTPSDLYVVVHQSRLLVMVKGSLDGSLNEGLKSYERITDSSCAPAWEPLRNEYLPVSLVESSTHLALGVYRGQRCSLLCPIVPQNQTVELSDKSSGIDSPFFKDLDSSLEWFGLRSLLPNMDSDTFSLASRALQLYLWNKDHRFCGRCGSQNRLSLHDRAWQCDVCDIFFYPRISPCVIGLVTDGPRVLLARGLKHRPELFSCLAGFIEAGESAEQAFAREIKEEVNLDVNNIRYCGSQAWPFPGQLMLGFYADYAGGDLKVDGVEILEANWYTKNELPEIPSNFSISGTIIRDYLQRF